MTAPDSTLTDALGPADLAALDTYVKFWRASHAVDTCAGASLHGHGLTLSQFGVLEALYRLGTLNQRQLAETILRSSGNLTMVLGNLERHGLITRTPHPHDRRVLNVDLTPGGRDKVERLLPGHVRGIRQMLGVLSPEELIRLGELCSKLSLALDPRGRVWGSNDVGET